MATTIKTTKRDHFNALLSLNDVQKRPELIDFINHELELLDHRKSAKKSMTPTQKQNELLKDAIYEQMEVNRIYTVSEIIKSVDECAELSNQKVATLLRQMRDSGLVVRTEEKRKAYFSKVVEE